jgi:hypothetical protein
MQERAMKVGKGGLVGAVVFLTALVPSRAGATDLLDGCSSAVDGCGTPLVSGWLDGGALLNGEDPASGFHGPYNQTDTNEGYLNQAYLVLGRGVQDSTDLAVGGRLDAMFGTDFFLPQSKGFETNEDGTLHWNNQYYGLALPQAYGEIGNDAWSVKTGHFYTPIGFEGVPAPNNFFYSKSNSYMFAGPFTHWGALGSANLTDQFSLGGGIVNGWDALDRTNDSPAYIGTAGLSDVAQAVDFTFAVITGDEDNEVLDRTNRTRYSFIATVDLTNRLQYVFHHWLGTQDSFFANGESADWFGIDQYLFYSLSDTLALGARMEWFRDDDGVRIGLNRPSNPNKPPFVGSLYSLSGGFNWTPGNALVIRPEVRWDWFEGAGLPFEDGADDSQFVIGADAIWSF